MATSLLITPGDVSSHPRITPLDAGADILHRYQVQWSKIHEETVLSSKTLSEIEEAIAKITKDVIKRGKIITEFNSLLQSLPSLEADIDTIEQDLRKTIDSLQSLEEVIDAKQECLFDNELRKRFDTQYVLKIHEQRLDREFAKISKSMSKEHSKRVEEVKKAHDLKIQEKQRQFQAAFEKEVMQYKTRKEMKKSSSDLETASVSPTSTLEDIIVEADEADQETLEKFLQEEEEEQEVMKKK